MRFELASDRQWLHHGITTVGEVEGCSAVVESGVGGLIEVHRSLVAARFSRKEDIEKNVDDFACLRIYFVWICTSLG